jgi:transposase-like protein
MEKYCIEERSRILEELNRSGLSIQEFGRQRGISVNKLYGWRRHRTVATENSNHLQGEFVKIPSGVMVTIELPEGIRLRVPVEGLKKVLAELGAQR